MEPLRGVRVVECATYIAAPSGGMTLARLGADVIRVDPLGGAGDLRRWPLAPGGPSLYWTGLNKGKRSLTVDLRSPRGQELVTELITQPGPGRGVLLDNTVGWHWLDHDRLAERRPDLVHVRVQGRRDGGPALDYTVNAAAGIPLLTGAERSRGPVNHQLPAWDLLTGAHAAQGVLAGLLHRTATGKGGFAEIALEDVALAAVADLGWLAEAELTGADRPKQGNHVYGSFGTVFRTADGHDVMVVAMTPRQWRALREVTGTTDLFTQIGEHTGMDLEVEEHRYALRDVLTAVLQRWFGERELDTVEQELSGSGVLWQRYRSMTEVVREQRDGAGHPVLGDVVQPGVGRVLGSHAALRWAGGDDAGIAPAPVFGGDTEAVLTEELGLDDAEVAELAEAGVIASAGPR